MYEFECPHCGGINIRNEVTKNLVCEFCDEKFVPQGVIKKEVDEEEKNETLDFNKMKSFGSGQYLVGSDIAAGEYLFISNNYGEGYFEISEDPNSSKIIANQIGITYDYMVVNNGEFLKITDGRIYNLEDCNLNNIGINWNADDCGITYRVGIDIEQGTYKLYSDDGYYEVYSGPLGKNQRILSNDIFSGQCYVSVKNGQYLRLHKGTKIV